MAALVLSLLLPLTLALVVVELQRRDLRDAERRAARMSVAFARRCVVTRTCERCSALLDAVESADA